MAIGCRDDLDWRSLKSVIGAEAAELGLSDPKFDDLAGRIRDQDRLEEGLATWCAGRSRWVIESDLQAVGVPAAAVARPGERIDGDIATGGRNLWPMVEHPAMGGVRVDGEPARFSVTDWAINHSSPTLGQHNRYVFGDLLGRSDDEIAELEDRGAI